MIRTCWLSWDWLSEELRSSLLQTLASPFPATWNFAACSSHLALPYSVSVLDAGGSAAGVSSVWMGWSQIFSSCLIHTCHWLVICKLNQRPGWWPGAGFALPSATFWFIPVYSPRSWSAPCCVSQIIQQILEIYFNDWLEKSMLYMGD